MSNLWTVLYIILFWRQIQKASCCCVGVSNTTAEGLLANFTFFSLLTTVIKLLIFFFFFLKVIEMLSWIYSFAVRANENAKKNQFWFTTIEIHLTMMIFASENPRNVKVSSDNKNDYRSNWSALDAKLFCFLSSSSPKTGNDDRWSRWVCDRPTKKQRGNTGELNSGNALKEEEEYVSSAAPTPNSSNNNQSCPQQGPHRDSGPARNHQTHPTTQR